MAQYTFQEQLLSVMEIVARAATEEINRRVADSCAVIRVELSRSQKDIDSLKKKCQLMENELKKVRGRGRRKVLICSSSEKLPFQGLCERNTGANACRAEQPVPTTQEDPEASTQHIHQTNQILEDTSAVTTIKEERNENHPWSSGDAENFLYECHSNKSHIAGQETTEEQNRFSEDTENQRTHLTHISAPVTGNEIHPSSLRLQVKTEKEEEEEKDVEVILLEGSEQRREDTIHSELAYNNNINDADRLNSQSFNSPELSCGLQSSVFSQHVMEATIEQSGNDKTTIPDDPIEMYSVGQIGVHEQPQPAWCRDRSHPTDHTSQIQSQRRHGSSTYQHRRALSRPSEDRVGVSMACHPAPNIPNHTFSGRGRGGFRRSRAQWVLGNKQDILFMKTANLF
ncbi:hypothetical protein Baya_10742 [Bagarius yarrelli]|uniref:Uncharacterized protein n=1 Tax=Bagarius yarrelli TaxID=175774 RepID=A0A556UGD2_BAGYA|nr:hypothetical protein Baya_10742 [Bagarius yarrelli]